MIIEGAISVKAVVGNPRRKVNRIYIDESKKSNDFFYIINGAARRNIELVKCSRDQINELAAGRTHGGVIADCEPSVIPALQKQSLAENGVYCLLEGIEDCYNLGYIMRSLYAFGVIGLILPRRNWNEEETIIIKSSAGASEMLEVFMSDDLDRDIRIFRERNYRIVSAFRGQQAVNLYHSDLKQQRLLFCIGGPLRGLSRAVLDNSDEFIYIPYASDFRNALNAASAAAVIASEIYRQKNEEVQ